MKGRGRMCQANLASRVCPAGPVLVSGKQSTVATSKRADNLPHI